jgi:hypothetical protein
MNFNTWRDKRGEVWTWIRDNTPTDALVAGHPTWIDPVMLYGERRGYVTTETAHPFYDGYYEEIKRRLEIALAIHYASSWEEVLSLAKSEGIDFVVFQRSLFRPKALSKARYFQPFNKMLASVRARGSNDFAYLSLPEEVETDQFPALVFVDHLSKVVDIKRLEQMLGGVADR